MILMKHWLIGFILWILMKWENTVYKTLQNLLNIFILKVQYIFKIHIIFANHTPNSYICIATPDFFQNLICFDQLVYNQNLYLFSSCISKAFLYMQNYTNLRNALKVFFVYLIELIDKRLIKIRSILIIIIWYSRILLQNIWNRAHWKSILLENIFFVSWKCF